MAFTPKEEMRNAADVANAEIVHAQMPNAAAQIMMTESLLVTGFGMLGTILEEILRAVKDLRD